MRPSNRSFMAGAKGRLLPLSVPFRYFAAAAAYHVLAWLALFLGADTLPRFAGGLGWTLAGLHLVTLGVLLMTAIGASLQLLPVATLQPVYARRAPALIWWLYAPGVGAATLGMGVASPALLAAGALAVALALLAYAALLARNLAGARGMRVVVAHAWIALAALTTLIATAPLLALAYVGMPLFDRGTLVALHVAFAAYGVMGMLSLGLSYILVPMFALAATPDERLGLVSCALAATALSLAALAAFGMAPRTLRVAAIGCGLVAVTIHLVLMTRALREGLRRELGTSFRLVRLAWAMLPASLVVACALVLEVPVEGIATLFGLVLIAGWLLTFVLGVLQRIAPFLASMHATPGERRPPTPSTLTHERALAIHFRCHATALALLALAVLADSPWATRAATAVGAAGAIAYGAFMIVLHTRLAAHARSRTAMARNGIND